mmetsp:Transcript_33036/g.87331  ORF Transcript_33036/g.87331 Transcript_33036/m.87331 type:complete len:200 (+) Transcript_33036:7047-7646(+)
MELKHLGDLVVDCAQPHACHGLSDDFVEFFVLNVLDIDAREEILAQGLEATRVCERQLGQGVHAHSLQQQDGLLHVCQRPLRLRGLRLLQQAARKRQDGFQLAKAPIVVLLEGKQLLREDKDCNHLLCQDLGTVEALRKHHNLRNELVVRHAHGHRAEQLLQVVGELLPPTVALGCRVHCDEDACVVVHLDLPAEQLHI